jgi:RND family efflux transporter MFP subunit
MKVWKQLMLAGAIVLGAAGLAARFLPSSHAMRDQIGMLGVFDAVGLLPAPPSEESAGDGWGGGGAPQVKAAAVLQLALQDEVVAIGSGRGVQSVVLGAGLAGRVQALQAASGQWVEAGAPILSLDAEDAELEVERARLMLEDARATLARQERLAGTGATSDLARQEAQLALRKAELDLRAAERALADHRITAPIAGYLGLIAVQPGDLVTPATEIARIEDRRLLTVDFSVPERVAARLTVGDAVWVALLAQPDQEVEGRITALDSRLNETSRSLRVQAQIANADDRWRAGMAMRVRFTFTGDSYPAVDTLAIQWGASGAYVWVLRDGLAERQPVRIVQRNAEAVLVEAGFRPGDLVVSEGVQALRPGAPATLAGAVGEG